jgi:hypothetical protein
MLKPDDLQPNAAVRGRFYGVADTLSKVKNTSVGAMVADCRRRVQGSGG